MLWRQKGRGKFISLSVYYANHRERIDQNNSVCALVIHASQQQDLPALCNNLLLLQSLLQAEELQLEQRSPQRHTFQQKSLSLNCNKNGKWKHGAHVLKQSPLATPKGTHYSVPPKTGKHISPRQRKILQDLSPEHIVCRIEYKGLMFTEAQNQNETHSSTDSDTTYDYFSCAEHSVCSRKMVHAHPQPSY